MTHWLEAGVGLLSLAGLVGGSEVVIRHCIRLMKERGLSGGFVGLTVISIGTSLPELVTHVVASLDILAGRIDLQVASATVVGMSVGSDIVQQTFILGLVGLIGVLEASGGNRRRDLPVLIAVAAAFWLAGLDGLLSRAEGAAFVVAYLGYLAWLYTDRKDGDRVEQELDEPADRRPAWFHAVWIAGGLAVIVLSGHFMLGAVEHFVRAFGLGGSLLGVFLVGISTTLPELSTAIVAIRKKEATLSIGTLVGSNITNPAFGASIGAMISTYAVPDVTLDLDLPVKVGTAILVWIALVRGPMRRWAAATLIAAYLVYAAARVIWFSADTFGAA